MYNAALYTFVTGLAGFLLINVGSFPTAAAAVSNCKCGYMLSAHNNAIMTHRYNIDFRKYETVEEIEEAGMNAASGYSIGGEAPDGTRAVARHSNIHFDKNDGMLLTVPGRQKGKKNPTGAEVSFENGGKGMISFLSEAIMKVDSTPGTCQSHFSFTSDYEKSNDEQDMEIIAASLLKPSKVAPAGLQLTNYQPNGKGSDATIVPFPTDPSKGFHKYSIFSSGKAVQYVFDNKKLKGPTKYYSVNPSNIILNSWTNFDPGFMAAPPPTKDVTLRVQSLNIYYNETGSAKLPAKCRRSDICVV